MRCWGALSLEHGMKALSRVVQNAIPRRLIMVILTVTAEHELA